LNFAILPVTSSVDLFFVGKLGETLAVAGQLAANQVFSSAFWLTNAIPTVIVSGVARAYGAKDIDSVQQQLGGAIFVSVIVGLIITAAIACGADLWLRALGSSESLPWARPYLRWRIPGVVADSIACVGFSAFRAVQNTVIPLQVAFTSNLFNCILDPLLIFPPAGMGVAGAALATSASQILAAAVHMRLLLKQRLIRWSLCLRPPPLSLLRPLLAGAAAVLTRGLAFNAAFITITRTVGGLDTTGTAAAAHALAIQLWSLGATVLFAASTVASILVGAERGKGDTDVDGKSIAPGVADRRVRAVAARFLSWGGLMGAALAVIQVAMLPLLARFTPDLPAVAHAARSPYLIGAALQTVVRAAAKPGSKDTPLPTPASPYSHSLPPPSMMHA
jgi:MATE family multidrug resistance protein